MNWIEYLPLAQKTLSNQFHCSDTFHQNILHAVIGALTEVEEILSNYNGTELVTDINKQGSVAEESADIFWYLSILFRDLDIRNHNYIITDEFKLETPFDTLMEFTKQTLKFLDLLKKKIYYNKEINKDIMIDLSIKMHALLSYYCHQYNTDVNDLLSKNIEKLKARYGDAFSTKRAIDRDLEAERKILEAKKSEESSNSCNFYLDGSPSLHNFDDIPEIKSLKKKKVDDGGDKSDFYNKYLD